MEIFQIIFKNHDGQFVIMQVDSVKRTVTTEGVNDCQLAQLVCDLQQQVGIIAEKMDKYIHESQNQKHPTPLRSNA